MADSADRDARIDAALDEYLRACDAGSPPDQSAFLARYPDLADELAAFLADHARMRAAARPDAETVHHTPNPGAGFPADPSESAYYFGDYELLEEVARGGMGVVYKARQRSLGREVAVKMILAGEFASPANVQRFRDEAEAAAGLDHPNILPIYEVGEHEGQPYFSMKLVEGGSLADLLKARRRPSVRRLVGLLGKVALAVHFAHRRGVLHRDLKPANILIGRDERAGAAGDPDEDSSADPRKSLLHPYVTDFGLARRLNADRGQTRTGDVIGTPSYMSPEQARGERGLTTAADVYSLGAILYEILTARPPFQGETVYETIRQVTEDEPEDPRSVNPEADPGLSAVALRCLRKDPDVRYETAGQFAADLARWRRGEPTTARPPGVLRDVTGFLGQTAGSALAVLALGLAWGGSFAFAVFALIALAKPGAVPLLPDDAGPLNPVRWIAGVQQSPTARTVVLGLAVVLTIGIGPLVRLAARPWTTYAALATAATVGLLATLTAHAFLGTTGVAFGSDRGPVRLHPVDPAAGRGRPVPAEDAEYLGRFLPPDLRAADAPDRDEELARLARQAEATNRLHAGVTIGGATLIGLGGFFLILALSGTWAADVLAWSGLGWWSRTVLRAELLVFTWPTAALAAMLAVLAVLGPRPFPVGALGPLALSVVLTALAHLFVVAQSNAKERWLTYGSVGLIYGMLDQLGGLLWGAS